MTIRIVSSGHQVACRKVARLAGSATSCLALLCMAASLSSPAHAQPASDPQAQPVPGSTWLDTITIIGTRTEQSVKDSPRSVTVLDREALDRGSQDSIAEMLRDVPGVEVTDESVAGMKRLRIRGESSRRITILVDGQEITDHSTYGTPLLVDPATVERIEVLRGPGSVLWGAKAIGGVVNIITRKGADKPVQAEAGGSYFSGSNGWQGWAAVSGSLDGFDYRVSASRDRHGDRQVPDSVWAPNGELKDTSFNNRNLYGHFGYRFGTDKNHYLALKLEQHKLESEAWPGVSMTGMDSFRIDLPKRDRFKMGVYYDGTDISDTVKRVHLDAYYQTIDRLFRNDVTTAAGPGRKIRVLSTSDDQILNIGGTAQVDLSLLENHYTIAGVQFLTDRLDTNKTSGITRTGFGPVPISTRSGSSDKAHIDTYSAFAQDEWSIGEHFKFLSGLRLYHTRTGLDETTVPARAGFGEQNDTRLVTSAGLTYDGIRNTVLRASYSEGYITPTLLQMFSSTTAGGQGTTYGNPFLEPETSRNFEVGARFEQDGFTLDGAAFYSLARNYITTQRCLAVSSTCLTTGTPASPASVYVNADKANTYGFELLAEYAIGNTGFTPYAGGAWTRRQLKYASYSTYNSDTPELSGRLGLRYEQEFRGVPLWADVFMRGATGAKMSYQQSGKLVTETLPGWATLNLAVGGSYGKDQQVSFALQVNNILDKAYRPSFGELPAVGRSVELTAKIRF